MNPRHVEDHGFCRPSCRAKWHREHPGEERQHLLDFAPLPAPLPPVQDQRLDLAEEEKLRGDNALVLHRLRQGPATTADLQAAAPRSMAIHSRVADVRAYLQGLGETVRRRKAGPRLHLYWIEDKP